jgi:hypothetical protein
MYMMCHSSNIALYTAYRLTIGEDSCVVASESFRHSMSTLECKKQHCV